MNTKAHRLSKKTLVIIRHAHRIRKNEGRADNGLSRKGVRQAKAAADFFLSRFGLIQTMLLSSPKKRCIETLEPLSKKLALKITPSDLLLENSNPKALSAQTQEFCRWWKKKAPNHLVICTHGDWIPVFFQHALGIEAELKIDKGGWAELELSRAKVELRWLIQDFKSLS